jgi:hypothetical protein
VKCAYGYKFNPKKVNEVEGKGQYLIEISNTLAALEHLDTDVDITRVGKLLDRISKFQPKRF